MSIINFTVQYDALSSLTDSADIGADADVVPLVGTVTFTPVFNDNKQVLAPGYSPRPACFTIRNFVGVVDTDGRLKASKGGAVGVRLWANDPVLELETLTYRCDFNLSTTLGEKVTVESGYFEAPSEDSTINLADVLVPTGSPSVSNLDQIEVFAHEIKDSSTIGVTLMTADEAKTARLALEPAIFDARDYGVIADGQEHNNVANLLDCFQACADAGGGTILLPSGVICTSEADIGTVTADSGNTYTNNGGIPIPVDTPITVEGHGTGVTVIKLSTGFRRAFDFWFSVSDQHYRDVTVRNLTVDRDNIIGTAIAPSTAVTGSVTLTGSGTWTTLPGISATAFKNAQYVYFSASNSGSAANRRLSARINGSAVQVLNNGANLTLSSGDHVQGAVAEHVIIGSICGVYRAAINMTFENILIENCEAINVAESAGSAIEAEAPNRSGGVDIYLSVSGTPAAVPAVRNLRAKNVRVEGGAIGISVCGNPNTFVDDIWFEDCFHDTMVEPISNSWNSVNYMIGGYSWTGRCGITRCHGRRSGDVAYEIDQPWEAHVVDCLWEEGMSGCYSTTFVPPARTADGPPTTTLTGTISSGATTATVTALPTTVSRVGLATIESELVWYAANAAGTTLTLTRGLNGSTAASHTNGSTVTFVEIFKTRLYDVRSTIRNKTILNQYEGGRAFLSFTNAHLPLTPLTIRDTTIDFVGGSGGNGRVLYWEGWRPDLDIQGMKCVWTAFNQTSGGGASLIAPNWAYGSAMAGTSIPQPRIYGRNNTFSIQGKIGSGISSSILFPIQGWASLDFDATYESILTGIDYGYSAAVRLGAGVGTMVLAPGSRLGIKLRAPYVASDLSPQALVISNSNLTIPSVLDVDLDLSEMSFAENSTDSNYRPWFIDSAQVGKVRFGKIIHPQTVAVKHPNTKRKMTVAVSSTYTVQPVDEVIMVDTTAQPVTITLPNTAGGASGLGEPISRGRELTIIDAGYAAGSNAITIAPYSGDKIDTGAAGATTTININGGQQTLVANPALPGWTTNRVITNPKIDTIYDQNNKKALEIVAIPSAVNHLVVRGSTASGTGAGIGTTGDDASVPMWISAKGCADVMVYAPTGNNVSLWAQGADSNVDINLIPKGTGKVTANGYIPVVTTTESQTLTNKNLSSGTNTFPTFNQNTTGSAAKLTTARTISGVAFDGTANITVTNGEWIPADHGFKAWSYDPATNQNFIPGGWLSDGQLYLVGLKIPVATTISNVSLYIGTAGSGLTSGRNFAGLYQNNALLAATNDQTSNWQSAGVKTMNLTSSQSVSAGIVYVGFFVTGTTRPEFAYGPTGAGATSSALGNVGLSSPNLRGAAGQDGLTTAMPGSIAYYNANYVFWAAVS